jgi:hypothetical protein
MANNLPGNLRPRWLTVNPGDRYNRLSVVRELERSHGEPRKFLFQCDCGALKEAALSNVRSGVTTSCGCRQREGGTPPLIIKHGQSGKKGNTYTSWHSMKQRCLNPNATGYEYYGGQGITIHPEWLSDFSSFVRDVGERPSPRYSLDRFPNPHGNYEPGNVRWATKRQQQRNMRNNLYLTIDGVQELATDVADRIGISHQTIRRRIHIGAPIESIIATSPLPRGKQGIPSK